MHTLLRCALASGLLAASVAMAASPTTAVPTSAAAPVASAAAQGAVDKRVIQDGQVLIEETRVQGQAQSVTVTSKLPGVKAYEVIQPPLGKDPSQDKGAAGKRIWSLFDF
jgi:lipopolysaccharide export system protein LptA